MCTRCRLLRGSGVSSSAGFLASGIDTQGRGLLVGCPVHQHVPWGVWSLADAIVATTHFPMAQVTQVGHTHGAAVFSLSTDSIYLPIRSAWTAGCRGVFSDIMEQQAGRAAGWLARQQCCPDPRSSSLAAMVTGSWFSRWWCPLCPEPTSCSWKRSRPGPVLGRKALPSAVPSSPAPQD